MKTFVLLFTILISSFLLTAQDGTLDQSFGINGHAFLNTTYPSAFFQSGGQLLGVLPFSSGFKLTRYDNNGNLDMSFGIGGTVTMNIPGISQAANALVAVFNNDDIIVAVQGDSVPPIQNPKQPNVRFYALVKLKSNGVIDATFGNNGIAIEKEQLKAAYTVFASPPRLVGLSVTEGEKIFTTKVSTDVRYDANYTTKRFNSNGFQDNDFAPYFITYYYGYIDQFATVNEDIVAVGGYQNSDDLPSRGRLRINTSSTPAGETTYGTIGGLTQEVVSAPSEGATAVGIQQDGKFVVSSISGKMLRFNADLTLDNDFGDYIEQNKSMGYTTPSGFHYTYGEKGAVVVPFNVDHIMLQPDNKILVAAGAAAIARYNADGTIDNTFGTSGITYANVPGQSVAKAIRLATNRIYVYSTSYNPNLPPGSDVITAFTINTTCTPPTFLNSLPIVGNATCGNNDGQISTIPQSGTAPYLYSLDGGATYVSGPNAGYTKFNLAPGTYQLRLKDANGCESEVVTRTIATTGCHTCTPPTFLNTLPIVGDASCNANDGQISIIPTSGTGPFMYSIDGGANYISGPNAGYTFFNLAPGTYQLRLKDMNGCESAIITRSVVARYGVPTFLNARPIVGDATCNQSDGQISIIPTSGTGPFMYSINGGASYIAGPNGGTTFFNLPADTYQLRIKTVSGCESEVITRTIENINCPSDAPTVAGASKGFAVDENALESKLKVSTYPNPSRGQFKLQVLQSTASKAEVFIYDGKGTLVQQAIINPATNSTINVNLSGKAKGMYHVKVVTQQGISTLKMLIQ